MNFLSKRWWEYKEELFGLSLTWAADNSWKGLIREDEVLALSKYNPQTHSKGCIRDEAEAEESQVSSSENSEETAETSDEDICSTEIRTKPNTQFRSSLFQFSENEATGDEHS